MKEWEGMFQNQCFVLGMPELPQGVAVMEILEAHSSARNLMADGSYMALWVGALPLVIQNMGIQYLQKSHIIDPGWTDMFGIKT